MFIVNLQINMLPSIDERLKCAASMVDLGARLADIGSDHAYLPIYLCAEGKINEAVASDINAGPVASAEKNIKEYGMSDKIVAVRADGLCGIDEFSPDCVTVLGMGGELIISILASAEWIKSRRVSLILQPMTHAELLYKFLLNNGFSIEDEKICRTDKRDDRIYRLVKSRYTGIFSDCSDVEALIGRANIKRLADENTETDRAYVKKIINIYRARIRGKESSGRMAQRERDIVSELESLI